MPTVGHEPPGTARSWAASPLYTSISRVPAPTVAVPDPESTWTEDIEVTSTTRPVVDE